MSRTDSLPQTVDELLRHQSFVRALARRLVAGGHDAEDVAQDTYAAALADGGGAVAAPRRWLARIAGNAARQRRRSASRRERRERATGAPPPVPSAAEVAEALDTQRAVATAVAALPEPYRTVVFLRFYRGLDSRQIAVDLGVPLETVRTRIKRALAQLRARLDGEFGSRAKWAGALAPLMGAKSAVTAGILGGLTMKASKVVALALVGLGVGAVWWLTDLGGQPAGVVPATNEPVVAANAPGEDTTPLPARAEVQETPPPAAEPDTFELRGRVLVTDENDQVWERASGHMRLGIFEDGDRETREVAVEAGSFRATLPSEARFLVWRLDLEDRMAVTERRVLEVPESGEVVINARFLASVALRVVDAASGMELPSVEVSARSSFRAESDDLHPGDSELVKLIARDVPSPVVLPPIDGPVVYWARAPGYGYGRALIRHDRPGQRTIELKPGAAVEVIAVGELPEGTHARLFRADGWSKSSARTEPHWAYFYQGRRHAVDVSISMARPAVIEGLPPGPYLARLQVGEYESARTIGEATCELRTGERVQVTVEVDNRAPASAALAGTLRIPEELVDKPVQLSLFRRRFGQTQGQKTIHLMSQKMDEDPADPRLLSWDAGEVLPGEYYAYVAPVQHRQVFTVPADGLRDLVIELPAWAKVTVALRDADTGAPVTPTRAGWSDATDLGLRGNMRADARVDRRRGEVSFITVAGLVDLDVEAADYEPASADYEVFAGENTFTLALRPALGMRFEVRADGALLPQDWQFWSDIKVERPEGASRPHRTSGGPGYGLRYFRQPGTYRVVFPVVEGYEPVPPRDVVLTRGITVVVMELKRAR